MGTISFLLPNGSPDPPGPDLERACMVGGYDHTPSPGTVTLRGRQLTLRRDLDESGYLAIPWPVEGAGRLLSTTATLIEREAPYDLLLELARGKVNQLRCQTADWRQIGLPLPPELDEQVREVSRLFGRAVALFPAPASEPHARSALEQSARASDQLVGVSVEQFLRVRHQKQPRLDTGWGVRVNGPLPKAARMMLGIACNHVCLPISWKQIEPTASEYDWSATDDAMTWAEQQRLAVAAGPLVDFSRAGLPDWLSLWDGDLPNLASVMCDYVETVVARYRLRVRRWQLTAGSNTAAVLGLGEDEQLWLLARLAEAAWQIDPDLELVLGISQPWGEYMTGEDHTYSPLLFADQLLRAGLRVAAIDVECVMGVWPRGSYCRDLLETSRLLDNLAYLGVPLQVTLGYPSASGPDVKADPEYRVDAGSWRAGFSPAAQADWARLFGALVLSKPYVRSVCWAHLSDAEPHVFPHSGLLDAGGAPKPAFLEWQNLRGQHVQ